MLTLDKIQEGASQRGLRWNHAAVGIFGALLATSLVTGSLAVLFRLEPWGTLVAWSAGLPIWYGIWLWTCQVPKAKKGHIGVALAIRSETEVERNRVRLDFIAAVQSNLRRDEALVPFDVVEIPSFLAPEIHDHETALKYMKRSRCALLIWGRISTRKRNKLELFTLRLEGAVSHHVTEAPRSRALSHEMRQAIPAKQEISLQNELTGFEMVSQSAAIAAKYIVALAAAVSNDWTFCKRLLLEVHQELGAAPSGKSRKGKVKKNDGELVERLRKQVPEHLANVCANQYQIAVDAWSNAKHDLGLAVAAETSLEESRAYRQRLRLPDGPTYWIPKAMLEVVLRQNFAEAARLLNRCRTVALNDSTWRLSLAFVKVLQGSTADALRLYDGVIQREVEPRVVMQVEDFIQWWLANHAGPNDLYLLSALLNAKFKTDDAMARTDLEKFESGSTTATHACAREGAAELRAELDASLSSTTAEYAEEVA